MTRKDSMLNELYSNLISRYPQTVTMKMPIDVGDGHMTQIVTKKGIILSEWEMNCLYDANVQGINSDRYLQIIFCLNEGVSWESIKEFNSFDVQRGEACIYKGNGEAECVHYIKKHNFMFKCVKIPVLYFLELMSEYFECKELQVYEKRLLKEFSKVKITPEMEKILSEINEFAHFRGELKNLYLDSKILELLAVYLDEVWEIESLMKNNISISTTERDSIMEAKQIIDAQLICAPSCSELAKQVRMSVSKLTKGFSNTVGIPIHTYIIEQRLIRGAQLLLEGNLNVSEVATIVGYTKPSNFSAAFKKKYGVTPKEYKKIRIY